MRFLLFAVLLLWNFSAHAQQEIVGKWTGEGTFSRSSMDDVKAAKLGVEVTLNAGRVHVLECWATQDSQPDGRGCINSDYAIVDEYEI